MQVGEFNKIVEYKQRVIYKSKSLESGFRPISLNMFEFVSQDGVRYGQQNSGGTILSCHFLFFLLKR